MVKIRSSVSDKRVKLDPEHEGEVSRFRRELTEDGQGVYCAVHTSSFGADHPVNAIVVPKILASYWKAYGVPRERITAMMEGRDLPTTGEYSPGCFQIFSSETC